MNSPKTNYYDTAPRSFTALELIHQMARVSWSIRRTVKDLRRNMSYDFNGDAVFKPSVEKWMYEERGTLSTRGWAGAVKRRYLYQPRGDLLRVCFEDGRLFYALRCADLRRASVRHECGQDSYEGHLSIEADRWSQEWRVRGPSKDLHIESFLIGS